MSFPVFAQARDSINKAYAVLQKWNTNPVDIPLPDVVNTRRPQMTQEQIAAAYLKSIDGNSDIDINKNRPPVLTQRSQPRPEWIDHALPLATVSREPESMKRDAACNRSMYIWPHPECIARYFDEYKEVMEAKYCSDYLDCPISFDLIGGGDPSCTCIRDLPQFVICSDQHLEKTLFDFWGWPQQILEYRNVSGLWSEYGLGGSCAREGRDMCPEPATTPEGINAQIDETLEKNPATVVYLSQSQLDDYLAWRTTNGTMEGFRYIRVADKKPAEPVTTDRTSSRVSDNLIFGLAAGAAAIGMAGVAIWAKIRAMNHTAAIRNIVASTSAPAHSAPTLRTASPSSMGSISTVVPNLAPAVTRAAPSTGPVGKANAAQSSSSSSHDSTQDTVLDIPPAGHEQDV